MLFGKWDADDSNKKQHPEENMHQKSKKTTENNPNNIERQANAPDWALRITHFRAERPKAEQPDLKRLQSHRNTDDRTRYSQTSRKITDSCFESTEEPPQQISNKPHHIFYINIVYKIFSEWDDGHKDTKREQISESPSWLVATRPPKNREKA